MNSVYTIDSLGRGATSPIPSTGLYHESPVRHPEKPFGLSRMAKSVGLAFSLAVSSVTAVPDLWLLEKRRRDAVVTMSIYQKIIGRFVSRSEALRIARQILEQAERERLAIAEYEAARGIQWGNEP